MARKKKPEIIPELSITAYAAEGKSIGHTADGKVVFVTGAVPGDVVSVRLGKQKKSWAEGKMLSLVKPAAQRVEPFCPHFGICGGCKWQMLPYASQLVYKQQQVQDQLSRIGGISLPPLLPIIGSELTRYYRNKVEFTFSNHRYFTTEELRAAGDAPLPHEHALGYHAPGLFDKVVPIFTCFLQREPTDTLLRVLRNYSESNNLPYYDFHAQNGWLRNAILRITTTGEVLINVVLQHEDEPARIALLEHLLAEIPEITSLHYTINGKVNDSLYDQDVITYRGPGFIHEQLEDFLFKISPKSFFQTNSRQAEMLYRVTRDFAGLTGNEVLYDLYCGTGSIGIFCSRDAKKVIGIEAVDDAIQDARINAQTNGLEHCAFFTGDVIDICTDAFFAEHGRPDVIITDPPRAGMHEKLVQQLLKIRAPRIVYVSCNPATQARDLALLAEVYEVKKLQPVDMFPHTHHIENVALLALARVIEHGLG